MTSDQKVSVIIPTYMEEENISDLLESVLSQLSGEDEIIVVDDSSPDGTGEKVRAIKSRDKRVKLVERKERMGIGSAYRTGFSEASGDILVQMDADFSHPPEDLQKLLEGLSNAEIAVGSRYVEEGERHDAFLRRIFPFIGSLLYTYILNFPVKDPTSGFKAIKREVVENTDLSDLPDDYSFQAASLNLFWSKGFTMTEVPYSFQPRKKGQPKYSARHLVSNIITFIKIITGISSYPSGELGRS